MDLEAIQKIVAKLAEQGVTVEAAIANAETELRMLRGLKTMTAAPKEKAAKPRASRKSKGEAAAG